jgi:hypothetical protein
MNFASFYPCIVPRPVEYGSFYPCFVPQPVAYGSFYPCFVPQPVAYSSFYPCFVPRPVQDMQCELLLESLEAKFAAAKHSPSYQYNCGNVPEHVRARLDSNKMTLYHSTSKERAMKIMEEGKMHRGDGGMAGGGIYFATTKWDAHRKAHAHGAILTCEVSLGSVKQIDEDGDNSINFESLRREGYDSVLIPRSNGHEYVVYSWNQVRCISVEYV